MAAGWWTVLKTVPWSEVISAAPQVATGARRLWDTVNRKPGAVDPATGLSPEMAAQEDDIIGLLIARSEQNDAELNDLRNQMRSASELIANLADQNAQLIAKMDVQRQKLTWLGVTAGLSALLAVVALILVAVRT
ncbi:hypothetical protein ABIB42_001193 [Massilia sp. UYP32]|jgi:hypothetical protein|uniref:Uncharacterized protein n=1 Tax=Massilia timonae TaxID=47229 RepID=A0A1S2NCC5_9BURK|nr:MULTISPECIES: hypothetical protein [Massilia]OIJ42042.1 hypothetical protein LO55_4462 [Massilia timonae]QYG02407.1 hypothetical protein KY496_02945 [Massilia sp. NP310]HAK93008.1 hypothetical protein [Massilia timonae]